ncbi:MAG: hypothetical protein HC935_02425 [Pseudanabaena sp. SU_2_4]|nr:hypothetical protein [Pseudanabaena sp. SU_2_4]
MFKKVYAIGLLSFASLGFASLPTQAQNVVNTSGQTANQAVVINGDRNKVKLRIIQVNNTNGQYSNADNLSTQRANQGVVIDGNGNRVDMRVRQVNAYNQSNRQFDRKIMVTIANATVVMTTIADTTVVITKIASTMTET